jgi:drug/metabolite transporter (DMT)-like permease
MGALNNLIPFSLIVWGQQHIDSGLASILNATTPLFTVALAHFLTSEEHLTLNRVIGILLGVVGVAILIGPDALRRIGAQGIAQLAVLGAACSYGLAGIFGRRFREMPSIIPAAGMLACTAIMMLPIVVLIYQPRQVNPELTTWGALFGLAILSTALAYLIYFRILTTAGATNLLLVTFLIPISALLLGVFVLGERLEWTLFSGMALIFAGLVGVDGRLLKCFSTLIRLHKAQQRTPGLARRSFA